MLRALRPPAEAVAEQVEDEWAWQVSHVGGDRFAGNLVVVPDGAYYGRVEPSEAWAVVEVARARASPSYRGRSCYGFAAQAAEVAVRGDRPARRRGRGRDVDRSGS